MLFQIAQRLRQAGVSAVDGKQRCLQTFVIMYSLSTLDPRAAPKRMEECSAGHVVRDKIQQCAHELGTRWRRRGYTTVLLVFPIISLYHQAKQISYGNTSHNLGTHDTFLSYLFSFLPLYASLNFFVLCVFLC